MKKWGFFIFACLLLFIVSKQYVPSTGVEIKEQLSGYADSNNSADMKKIAITEDQVYEGNLLLVNRDHGAQKQSIKKDIVSLVEREELMEGYGVLDNRIHLSEEIVSRFSEMMLAAEKDGVTDFIVTSGFRNFEEQEALYQEMGSEFALPAGYSEHNLGIALDIGSTQEKMANSPQGNWIEENSWKYGFILRYPKDKTDITGIQYEPWHIRYIGFPHSAIMKEKNFVLEEYLEYLQKEERISVTVNENNYLINYYNVSESMTITIPDSGHYEISGDNVNGVIVTFYE